MRFKPNDTRQWKRKFAWLPTRVSKNGTSVWLEHYEERWEGSTQYVKLPGASDEDAVGYCWMYG